MKQQWIDLYRQFVESFSEPKEVLIEGQVLDVSWERGTGTIRYSTRTIPSAFQKTGLNRTGKLTVQSESTDLEPIVPGDRITIQAALTWNDRASSINVSLFTGQSATPVNFYTGNWSFGRKSEHKLYGRFEAECWSATIGEQEFNGNSEAYAKAGEAQQ